MAIEAVFAVNLFADLVLLWTCGRLYARVAAWRRLAGAACAGAFAACLSTFGWGKLLLFPAVKLLLAPVMLLIAFGRCPVGTLLRRSLTLLALAALCAGLAAALVGMGLSGREGALFSSAALIACAMRRGGSVSGPFRVCFTVEGETFIGLLDTGNRLREPLSGLPVLVCGDRLFAHARGEGRTLFLKTAAGVRRTQVYALREIELEYGKKAYRIPLTWACRSEEMEEGLDAILPPWPFMEGSYDVAVDRKTA